MENAVITNEGRALLTSVIANNGTLTFTVAKVSDTDYVGQEATLTIGTFAGTFMEQTVSASVQNTTTIKVATTIYDSGNNHITEAHEIKSVGIVATDGNTTALLLVCTTSNPSTIEPGNDPNDPTSLDVEVNLGVSSTQNITVVGSSAGVLHTSDVVDNLTSTAVNEPLSANQGKVLKDLVDDNFSGQSNENLFDNPWFTVNQRGASGIITGANVYGYDRWSQAGAGGGYSITSDGPIILITMWQKVEDNSLLQGEKATFTMLYADGEITSGTGTIGDTITTSDGSTLFFPTNQYNISAGNTNKAVRAVKLELGEKSTLAHDVAPDYAIELAKCRASTADPSDTYANKGNLVNYADVTSIYVEGTTNTSGAQINAGALFYLNGTLCKALANIAVNAAFTLNTNYKENTVANELTTVATRSIAPDNYVHSTDVFEFYRVGKVVYFSGCNLSDTLPVGSSTIIASLPAELIPVKTWAMRGMLDPANPNDHFAISITSNGSVEVYRYTANSTNTVGAFSQSGSYIANN